MDKLAAIRTFVAIVECGSQTEAARRLGKSLPAVVRTLSELEKALSVQLLIRTTRHSHLTPEGALYLQDCKEILAKVGAAEARLRQAGDLPMGPISLTAPIEFGNRFVGRFLFDAAKEFPGLRFRVRLTDRPIDLVKGEFDIAIRIGELEDSGLKARKVGSMQTVVCASPELLDRCGAPARPAELADLPCVGVDISGRGYGMDWRFRERGGAEFHVRVEPSFLCDSVRLARSACLDGVGFGVFFSYQVIDELRDGRLKPVFRRNVPAARPVSLLWPPETPMPMRLREVIRSLADGLSSELRDLDRSLRPMLN